MSRFIHNYPPEFPGIFGERRFWVCAAWGRENGGAAPQRGRAAPAAADASAQALAAGGKVMPPTLTFTAAISRPVMDSTAFFTPSWTARPTSGMVWP